MGVSRVRGRGQRVRMVGLREYLYNPWHRQQSYANAHASGSTADEGFKSQVRQKSRKAEEKALRGRQSGGQSDCTAGYIRSPVRRPLSVLRHGHCEKSTRYWTRIIARRCDTPTRNHMGHLARRSQKQSQPRQCSDRGLRSARGCDGVVTRAGRRPTKAEMVNFLGAVEGETKGNREVGWESRRGEQKSFEGIPCRHLVEAESQVQNNFRYGVRSNQDGKSNECPSYSIPLLPAPSSLRSLKSSCELGPSHMRPLRAGYAAVQQPAAGSGMEDAGPSAKLQTDVKILCRVCP